MLHMGRFSSRLLTATLLAAGMGAAPLPVLAQQQGQGYFIPGQPKAQAPSRAARQAPARRAAPAPEPVIPPPPADITATAKTPPPQQALPPPPNLPPLPKGQTPPTAIVGVIGVPEVMHASSAAQQIEKAIGERRQKLNDDAQKEQTAWRDMQQALVNDRGKLSADQVRARERQLQERITNSQRIFRERGRIIQEAAQYALAQIERTLIAVIRQVADSRGMNLVLHRQQVALNVNEFDITQEVTDQMNKIMPSVIIPPEGVEPPTLPPVPPNSVTLPPPPKGAATSPAPAGKAKPAPAAAKP